MTIFTKIIRGIIPSYKVAESAEFLAFLDINPLTRGHALVIPKEEVDLIFDLSDERISGLMVFAKKVAKALDETIDCTRVGMIVAGLEVPHAHIHLVPMQDEKDLSFSKPRVKMTHEEFVELADQLQEAFVE